MLCRYDNRHFPPRILMSYIYIYMEHLFLMFLDHTQRRTTVGRTPLDEWSARRRDLYLTTHETHNTQTSMPLVGFEPTISAGAWMDDNSVWCFILRHWGKKIPKGRHCNKSEIPNIWIILTLYQLTTRLMIFNTVPLPCNIILRYRPTYQSANIHVK